MTEGLTDLKLAEALAAPFAEEDILFRLFAKSKDKSKAKFVPYVRKGTVIKRLNEVLGPFGWETNVQVAGEPTPGVIVTLTILSGGGGISRSAGDCVFNNKRSSGAEGESAMGQDFTLASSTTKAFVSAAELFGVGAYLYGLETQYVAIDQWGKPSNPLTLADCNGSRTAMAQVASGAGGSSSGASVRPATTNPKQATNVDASGKYPKDQSSILRFEWLFGKNKGLTVEDIIASNPKYFEWLLNNSDNVKPGNKYYDPAYVEFLENCKMLAEGHELEVQTQGEAIRAEKQNTLFGLKAVQNAQAAAPTERILSGEEAVEAYSEALQAGLPTPTTEDPSKDSEFMNARAGLIKDFKEKFGVTVDFENGSVSPFSESTLMKMMEHAGEQIPF